MQADKQTGRQADRQADRETYVCIYVYIRKEDIYISKAFSNLQCLYIYISIYIYICKKTL